MELWCEKYRPNSLDVFVGNEGLKSTVAEYLKQGNIQNLLFHGPAGCGKTSLAKLIAKELEATVLYLNASNERGIETIREKIVPFASSMGLGGVKIIILDESDYLTPQAQASLRHTMEEFHQNCRFILTCNYVNRIIDPIHSRCKLFNVVPLSKKAVAEHLIGILKSEEVTYTTDDVVKTINLHYPDMRQILNFVQGNVRDKVLDISSETKNSTQLNLLVDNIIKKEKASVLRQQLVDLSQKEYDHIFRAIYDRVDEFSSPASAIILVSKYQYEYNFILDKEIGVMALLVELTKI